jgi:predicted ATPase/DNA-binding SARP family transcriptional activator
LGTVEYALLGPLAVTRHGAPVEVGGARLRLLLVALLVRAPRVVPLEVLVDALWGDDPPPNAKPTVQTYVSQLRRVLAPEDPVETIAPGYRLVADPASIDSRQFEQLAAEGRRTAAAGDLVGGRGLLERALALWRGAALAEFRDREFAQAEAVRLEELRASTEEVRWTVALQLGEGPNLVGELETAVAEQPLRERRWELLMLALHHSGRSADALRTYRRAAALLDRELGLRPGSELRHLEERILLGDPSLGGPVSVGGRHNLPAARSRFVGRQAELAELRTALAASRLVTLTGPAGTGKTRLAVELARGLVAQHPDGVWLVELASLSSADGLAARLAEAVGMPAPREKTLVDTLCEWLAARRLVLVVDNCEHLVEAVAGLLDRLLDTAAGLRVLATSREPLAIDGEVVWPVPPLDLPPAAAGTDELVTHPAGELFIDRARAVEPRFRLTADVAGTIARVVRRLDGLPLAIELAAARVASLPVAEIEHRLDDRFTLLKRTSRTAAERHRTLAAAVEWSYELLLADEQILLHRLAAFAGSFDLSAATAVTVAGPVTPTSLVDLLDALVRKSLVVAERHDDGGLRYRLLETIRDFAREVTPASDAYTNRLHHAEYVADLVERLAADLDRDPNTVARSFRWLDRVADDMRAALKWAIDNLEATLALRIAAAPAYYWAARGWLEESHRWLEEALSVSSDHGAAPADIVVNAQVRTAYNAMWLFDLDRARELFESVRSDADRRQDRSMEASALNGLGHVHWLQGEWDAARRLGLRSLQLAEAAGQLQTIVHARQALAALDLRQGNLAGAEAHLAAAEEPASADPENWLSWIDYDWGILYTRLGRYSEAEARLSALLQTLTDIDSMGEQGPVLRDLAHLHLLTGQVEQAREEIEKSLELSGRSGDRWGAAATMAVAGMILAVLNDPTAAALSHRGRELFEALRDPWGSAWAELAVAHSAPDPAVAQQHAEQAVRTYRRLGDRWGEAEAFEAWALRAGEPAAAVRLCEQADDLRRQLGVPVPPVWMARRGGSVSRRSPDPDPETRSTGR